MEDDQDLGRAIDAAADAIAAHGPLSDEATAAIRAVAVPELAARADDRR